MSQILIAFLNTLDYAKTLDEAKMIAKMTLVENGLEKSLK